MVAVCALIGEPFLQPGRQVLSLSRVVPEPDAVRSGAVHGDGESSPHSTA